MIKFLAAEIPSKPESDTNEHNTNTGQSNDAPQSGGSQSYQALEHTNHIGSIRSAADPDSVRQNYNNNNNNSDSDEDHFRNKNNPEKLLAANNIPCFLCGKKKLKKKRKIRLRHFPSKTKFLDTAAREQLKKDFNLLPEFDLDIDVKYRLCTGCFKLLLKRVNELQAIMQTSYPARSPSSVGENEGVLTIIDEDDLNGLDSIPKSEKKEGWNGETDASTENDSDHENCIQITEIKEAKSDSDLQGIFVYK